MFKFVTGLLIGAAAGTGITVAYALRSQDVRYVVSDLIALKTDRFLFGDRPIEKPEFISRSSRAWRSRGRDV